MPRVTWSASSTNQSTRVTRAELKRYFNPVVVKHRDRAFQHYRTIVGSWKHKPKFARKTGMRVIPGEGLTIYSTVGINDNSTPLWWLDQGTKIRYRIMSPDWKSKTSANQGIATQRRGSGFAAGWGVAPGIEPRYFRRAIIKDVSPDFNIDVRNAFAKMCRDKWG